MFSGAIITSHGYFGLTGPFIRQLNLDSLVKLSQQGHPKPLLSRQAAFLGLRMGQQGLTHLMPHARPNNYSSIWRRTRFTLIIRNIQDHGIVSMSSCEDSVEDGHIPAQATSQKHNAVQRSSRSNRPRPACNTCKDRKVKCDRAEPQCGRCKRLDAHCTYGILLNRANLPRQMQQLQERLGKRCSYDVDMIISHTVCSSSRSKAGHDTS